MIAIIAAMAHNRVIGYRGTIPWHLPDDQSYFKRQTYGAVVIMGRRTYESIGHALPGRTTIVLSRSTLVTSEKTILSARTLSEAITHAAALKPATPIFIAGGAAVYRAALPLCEKLYLTEIDADVPGDVFFPEFNRDDFTLTEKQYTARPLPHTFVTYVRKKISPHQIQTADQL
ncbi:MAG: dihydrofolate reductase [Treponema sp.]|nr:dihydrofolate reductase [Treponema sp.]